ncbi:MAG: restriction endonuclease subunit S [Alteromonadaceae bacterium]|nr:restriction endonuclease subunit S [Alteromonadaceae bacterium]
MNGWNQTTIGDQITLQRGVDITKKETVFGKVPVISSGGISAWHNQPINEGPGVVIGRKGSLGTVWWSEGPFWPHDTTLWVKDFKGNNRRFVYYFLTTLDTKGLDVGAANPTLNRNHVHPLPIVWPTRSQQDEIAAVLGALDDKIELNRKTAATLEAMARALYRSWFVDFAPVHAKADGRTPAHMPPETAALFPARFGPDGLPEGWNMEPLKLHVNVQKGLSYKGAFLASETDGLPLHNLNSVATHGGYSDQGIKFYNGEYRERHVVQAGDLIVANTDLTMNEIVIGFPAIIPKRLGPSGLFSHHLFKVEVAEGSPLSVPWLYCALSSSWIGRSVRAFANGTTVNMLPKDAFEIPEIPCPPKKVVETFDAVVAPMFEKQDDLQLEIQTLAQLRDTLLPRLMSGELRVGEAKELVEDVA